MKVPVNHRGEKMELAEALKRIIQRSPRDHKLPVGKPLPKNHPKRRTGG